MMSVHFWINGLRAHVAQHQIFTGLLQNTIPEEEMHELCADEGFAFNAKDRGPWRHRSDEIKRAYNFYSPWSGFVTSSYYFEGRQFTPQQLMAETTVWIAFLDNLNAVAHNRAADGPDTVLFTTTNVFRSMLDGDGNMDPVVRLVKSLRVEFQGVTYTLDPEGLQPTTSCDSDPVGSLRATASALMGEFMRKEELLTKALGNVRGPAVILTPRMVRRGFVTFMDGESQILARRVSAHKTRYFAVRGARYPILPDWQARNNFLLCCSVGSNGSPEGFQLLTTDLRCPFLNAHTSASGAPCLGTAVLRADEDDVSPWETIFDSALAAMEVINFSSLNDWRVMDDERIERRLIEAAHAAPGWPTRDVGELAHLIRSGLLPFCDPGASPMEGWG